MKPLSDVFSYFLVVLVQGVLRFFSYRTVSEAGALAGLIFRLIGVRRAVVLDNLRQSNLAAWDERTVERCYANFGRTFFELLTLDRINPDQIGTLELPAGFDEDVKDGAFFLSAHFGNWELMGKVLGSRVRLAVVAQPLANPGVNDVVNLQRQRAGMTVIEASDIWRLRKCVTEKRSLAVLIDQNLGIGGVPVTFMGRPCLAPSGPFRMIELFRRPVYYAYSIRLNNNHHRFLCSRIELKFNSDLREMANRVYQAIEETIHRHPDQWFWHHRRWKEQS